MNVNEFLAEKEKLQKEFQNLLKEKGTKVLQDLFLPILGNEEVAEILWTQYTPYFNDGEACVFSVREPSLLLKKHLEELNEDEIGECIYEGNYWRYSITREKYTDYSTKPYQDKENPYYSLNLIIAWSEFERQFWQFEDVFESTFGDHCKVRAYLKDGMVEFEVEEYSHD